MGDEMMKLFQMSQIHQEGQGTDLVEVQLRELMIHQAMT
jgi:hypothetical protein